MSEAPTVTFPEILDSTIIATAKACPRKFYWSYIRNKRRPGESIHLLAGAAFAKGIEITRRAFFEKGYDPETALALGIAALTKTYGEAEPDEKNKMKSWLRVAGALEAYVSEYPLETSIPPAVYEGQQAIEFTFAIPIPIKHPETGNPLVIAGRADMIGTYNAQPFLVDEKTTKQLGPTWPDQWDLRAQFRCYGWAARECGMPVVGAIVRGVALYVNDYGFAEKLLYLQDWKLDQWYEQTLRDVKRMLQAWEEGYYDFAWGDPCNSYGGCPFRRLCDCRQPEPLVEIYYEDHKWNPLNHEGDI